MNWESLYLKGVASVKLSRFAGQNKCSMANWFSGFGMCSCPVTLTTKRTGSIGQRDNEVSKMAGVDPLGFRFGFKRNGQSNTGLLAPRYKSYLRLGLFIGYCRGVGWMDCIRREGGEREEILVFREVK